MFTIKLGPRPPKYQRTAAARRERMIARANRLREATRFKPAKSVMHRPKPRGSK